MRTDFKNISSLSNLALLIFLLLIPTNVHAEDTQIVERLSQDTIKVRGFGYHGFTFQDNSFIYSFPTECFDTSKGDVYWYIQYRFSNDNGDEQIITTSPTPGHYPTSFDYTVTIPEPYHMFNQQKLVQHCSNSSENEAVLNGSYNLNLTVSIARDRGVLLVDKGNTLDVYATGVDPLRVSPENYRWDLDNNGTFETQGNDIMFSAIGKTSGNYPITVKVSDQWDTAEDTFDVTVLEYQVNLTTPISTVPPGIVTEHLGFINPEKSLVEDSVGAVQDGNPEYFKIQYDFATPIFTNYHIARGEVIFKAKNTGTDAGKAGIQIFGDRKGSQISQCAEIVPSTEFVEYRCAINLHDYEDKTQKWTGMLLEFGSEEGRDEQIEIDSIALKYKLKESYLDLPLSAGGPYTLVKGQDLVVNANATLPSNGDLFLSWDFNNDGYYDEGGSGTSATYYSYNFPDLEPGTYPVGVKLNSWGGGSRIATTTFTIVTASVDAGGPYTVSQGQIVQLAATSNSANTSNYVWDLDNNGEFETQGQEVTFSAAGVTHGEHIVKVKATAPNGSTISDAAVVTVTESIGPTTLYPIADAYLKQGSSNQNEGGSPFMRLQSSGHNRGLIKFDQSQIAAAVGNSQNYTAKLQVTISDNGNNWGSTGRPLAIHRFTKDWAEGNGFVDGNSPVFRGTGDGVTWNCAIDSIISNQAKNCSGSTEWNMVNSLPYAAATTTATITNNQSGVIEFDVTSDVQSFINGTNQNYGWLLKKVDEGANGKVEFGSKESANSPQLVITTN